jgi:hypothetical protein
MQFPNFFCALHCLIAFVFVDVNLKIRAARMTALRHSQMHAGDLCGS